MISEDEMKYMSSKGAIVVLIVLSLSIIPSGCSSFRNFTGKWVMNIGRVEFVQKGSEITGVIEGYGGNWHESFQGTVNGNEATFSTDWFGDFTLVIDGDRIRSKSTDVSFCGTRRDVTEELPEGCGFSGKWMVALNPAYAEQTKGVPPPIPVIPEGAYMILTQTAENVTGNMYGGDGKVFDSITGKVNWGKGWKMDGSATIGKATFIINAAETGIEMIFGTGYASQFCAVRDGVPSAYIIFFTCKP